MRMAEAQRRLELANSKTFMQAFQELRGATIPTLSDESIALAFTVAQKRVQEPAQIVDELPEELRDFFKECQSMGTEEVPFFTRFVAFTRPPVDGMLVGFGADDLYYVLAVWDFMDKASWKPTVNVQGEPNAAEQARMDHIDGKITELERDEIISGAANR